MSTLLARISTLAKNLRHPNTPGVEDILNAVDSAIDAVAPTAMASNAQAKAGTSTSVSLCPSNLRQGGAAVAALEAMFLQHYQIAPVAAVATAVHAAIALDTAVQDITEGITNPDVPRNVTVQGNAAGVLGNVVITGTNILDVEITETIALNGNTEVAGAVAFKTVTNIHLPAESHAHARQVETATVIGLVTGAGNAAVTVTANGMTNSPKAIDVPVVIGDDAAEIAAKIRTVLAADVDVAAMFEVGGQNADISLTRLVSAANDGTLNIAIATGTATGITSAATSVNTTAGVAQDTVTVGCGVRLGLPHIVYNASCLLVKLFNGSADNGTLAVDSDEVHKNLFTLSGTPDGAALVDLIYAV